VIEKTLKNQLKYLAENHEDIAYTYQLLSDIYTQQGDLPKALDYLEKSVDIARISILPKNKVKFKYLESQLEQLKKNGLNGERKFPQSASYIQCVLDQFDLQDLLIRQKSDIG